MRARTLILGGVAVGILAWIFGRSRISTSSGGARPAAAAVVPTTYAELNRLDLEAVREFTSANAEAMAARAAGDTARADAAMTRYRAAYARHRSLAARALEAWNRENGVTTS